VNELSNEKQSDINVEEWLSTIEDMGMLARGRCCSC